MTTLVKKTRPRKVFYAKDINMSRSFDGLADILRNQLGGEVGDILVCDNVKKDKRKMLQVTADGFMIYYGKLTKKVFTALATHNGLLKNMPDKSIL